MRMTLAEGGINWCWYVVIDLHDDSTCTVLERGRRHNERDSHPIADATAQCLENLDRQLVAIDIRWKDGRKQLAQVSNQQHCFSYPDLTG